MGLFSFFNKLPGVNQITGGFGELITKIYAKTLPGALVIHDVLIDGAEGYTSQSDLVIVGNKGVYVVEVKTFSDAKIYGNTQKSTWYYYSHGKKYDIYSPLKQNEKHVKYLKNFLRNFGDIPFFSIVTMICDDFKISGKFDGYTVLCNSLPAMEEGIYKVNKDKPEVIDDCKKQEIFEFIKANQYSGKAVRREHKENVISYKKNSDEMKEQKICPYCKTELVLRSGKNGEFYGCSNFPKCRYTQKK